MSKLSNPTIPTLRAEVKGKVILPSGTGYNGARTIWNAMIDRHPAVIVQCAHAKDVAPAIQFAKSNNLTISILGGGHHIAGNSISEDGLVIDLSMMKSVHVNTDKRQATAQPGATLADFDKATQQYGLATPTGINSTTGLSGLTLGGGFGWLTRKYGMTIDNLLAAQVVTAKGKTLTADDTTNADLFWAIRGGGGNFGVVTEFTYKLHPVGPEVLAGLLVFPFNEAHNILAKYRKFVASAPEELNIWVVLRQAPPLPFLPESIHGKMVVVLPVFYDGDMTKGQQLIEFVRGFGTLHGEHIGAQPYTAWQQAFDPLLTPGARNYWKSHNFTELKDELFNKVIEYAGKLPSPQCEIFVGLISGFPNRVPTTATAYAARDAKFVMNVHARWEEQKDDDQCIQWARSFFKESAPYASTGAYVNFMTEEERDRVEAAYDINYERLVEIKTKYDPNNLFHMNQNIKPRMLA